jgi:DNA-binding MarR family transcriptional regulator
VPEPEQAPLYIQAWLAFLRAHARLIPRVSQELERACGISLAWYDVLFQLSCAPQGQLRMRELADAVLLSRSGLTRLVDPIEAAKLVARASVPGDRRGQHVVLLPAGQELVARARVVVSRSVWDHFGSHLSDSELEALRDALDRVSRAARDGDAQPAAGVPDEGGAFASRTSRRRGRRPPLATKM